MEGVDRDQVSGTGRDAIDDSFRVLVSRLSALEDPRQAGKVSYPLVEMSMVAVAGVIADCDGWEDVADFGRDRLDWLRQFLPFENGVPSHDTFARVFSVVNVEQLEASVTAWVEVTFLPAVHASRESPRPGELSTTGEPTTQVKPPLQNFARMCRLMARRCVDLTIAFMRARHFMS